MPQQKGPLAAGVKVGDFIIRRMIGEGGFGRVYEAHHAQLGERWRAAVKELIHPDPSMVDRFIKEAELLLGLRHPNIPQIYALTEERNRKFIIMEWVDGGTLQQAAHARQIEESHLIRVGIEVCNALEAMHSYRPEIIHRDIKAENIMIRWGSNFHVWVMDLGVAHALEGQRTTRTVVGTKFFACPEQLKGQDPHPSFDIFSLGGTLFYVMGPYSEIDSRFPPFPYDRYDGPDEVARKLAGYPYSQGLRTVVVKAMAYAAQDRYQSATDMRRALEQLSGYTSVAHSQPSPPPANQPPPPAPSTSGPTSTVTRTGWLPVGKKNS